MIRYPMQGLNIGQLCYQLIINQYLEAYKIQFSVWIKIQQMLLAHTSNNSWTKSPLTDGQTKFNRLPSKLS